MPELELICNSYDGDDNEEPARETAPTQPEPENDTTEDPSPVIAAGSGATEEPPAQEEAGQDDMQGYQQQNNNDFGGSYGQPQQREERPIGTKEDGYVSSFARDMWLVA
jgi:hypothetical protein